MFACSIRRVETAEWMRKLSLGTIGLLIRNYILTSAWHGFPVGCGFALIGGFSTTLWRIRIGLVLFGRKYTSSTAMVWAWLKRKSFNGTDFWELHLCVWKSISRGIIQVLFFMGDSCWKQAGPGHGSVLLAYKITFLSTQDGWQIR